MELPERLYELRYAAFRASVDAALQALKQITELHHRPAQTIGGGAQIVSQRRYITRPRAKRCGQRL